MERARVVLLAAEGKTDLEIAGRLRIGNKKAARRRKRFLKAGLGAWRKTLPSRAATEERRFRDVEELIMAIEGYIDRHNEAPKPFIGTAKANDILEKVKRARKALNNASPLDALH